MPGLFYGVWFCADFLRIYRVILLKFRTKIDTLKYLILLAAFICLTVRGFAQSNPPPVAKDLPITIDERVDGLGSRSTLIRHLRELDSDFVFKQIKDTDGQPDFYASDKYNTSVELVGREYNLVMVQWTFRMISDNGPATHLEINRMGGFAGGIGGKDGGRWFSNLYLKFKDKPLVGYTETKQLYPDRVAEFVYSPQLRKMTLTITLKPPTIEDLKVAQPKGLGNRAGLIRYISSADSDFVFKRRDDVSGKPDYFASDRYSTSVELVGNDDEIIMAKWTMSFVTNNESVNAKELDRINYFAGLMEPNHPEWFANFYKKIIGNLKEEYSETNEFASMSRTGVLNYNPQSRKMTLTVTFKDGKH